MFLAVVLLGVMIGVFIFVLYASFHLAGFSLIKTRAGAMQDACMEQAGGMLSVSGLEEAVLQEVIKNTETPHSHASIANYIFPRGYVVTGTTERIVRIETKVKKLGAITKRLKVSGAFHSCLMASAVPRIQAALEKIELRYPLFPVYSNITGHPYTSVDGIKEGLARQVTYPVQWRQTVCHMMKKHMPDSLGEVAPPSSHIGRTKFLEIGPGKQLTVILRRISETAFRSCDNVTV